MKIINKTKKAQRRESQIPLAKPKKGNSRLNSRIKNKFDLWSRLSRIRSASSRLGQNKHSQEELIGFAIIMVVVFVIILVFLGFSLTDREEPAVKSYEVEAFLDSVLTFTTTCEDYIDVYESVRDLLFKSFDGEECVNGPSEPILNDTIENLLNHSWRVGQNNSVKGYVMQIYGGGKNITFEEGNRTRNSRGSSQPLYRSRGEPGEITFKVYY